MNVIYAPNKVPHPNEDVTVFTAGSIEMGKAIDWQSQVIDKLKDLDVSILNPRRKDWDSSWEQDPEKNPFREQVLWELSSIGKADITFFYFSPDTVSPISLLELGLCLGEIGKKIIVCCPKEFGRYGNVKITCEVNGTPVYNSLNEAIEVLIKQVNKLTL